MQDWNHKPFHLNDWILSNFSGTAPNWYLLKVTKGSLCREKTDEQQLQMKGRKIQETGENILYSPPHCYLVMKH